LLSDIPQGTVVTRIRARRGVFFLAVLSRLLGKGLFKALTSRFPFLRDDPCWTLSVSRAGKKLVRGHAVDAVYSTSPIINTHMAAAAVQRSTGLPWIADFRDIWADASSVGEGNHRILKKRMREERFVVERADHIICCTEIMKDHFIDRYSMRPEDISVVYNGFDPDDFPKTEDDTTPAIAKKQIEIIHSGSFYGVFTPEHFLLGMVGMYARFPEWRERLRVRFIGRMDAAIEDRIRVLLGDTAVFDGYVPHEKAVAAVMSADIALVVRPHREISFMSAPGKIFEYLAAGTPILAAVPEGEAARIVRETGAGAVVTEEDPDAIAGMLPDVIESLHGGRGIRPRREEIEKFSRIHLTRRLAHILDTVTESVHA
jgi:glycosyltransferase involved in cell wall biosynthesis